MGEVEPDGGEGYVAVLQGADIRALAIAQQLNLAVHPVVDVAPGVGAAVEDLVVARAPHAGHLIALDLLKGDIRHIDVQQGFRRQTALQDLLGQIARHPGRGSPQGLREAVQGNRHAGDAQDGALGGGRYRAGIDHADARIGAQVDPADQQVRRRLHQVRDGQLHAIGGRSPHRMAKELARLFNRPALDRVGEGDGVPDRALLRGRGHHMGLAQVVDCLVEGLDTGCVDAVVVADEKSHASNLARAKPADKRQSGLSGRIGVSLTFWERPDPLRSGPGTSGLRVVGAYFMCCRA